MRLTRHRGSSPEKPPRHVPPAQSRQADGHSNGRAPETHPSKAAEEEARVRASLAELRSTMVREVMTPRVDVVGLPIPVTAARVALAVKTSGHIRLPVYDEDLDRLTGILFLKDLFRSGWRPDDPATMPTALEISRRLRQPHLVPESRLALDLLVEMREGRWAFAVVVDEYGSVAGVVTAGDIIAQLVGDVHDELDQYEEPEIARVDDRRWLVDGSCSLDDIQDQMGMTIPGGEYVTLGGYLFDALGHIPNEGESTTTGPWELTVAEMDRRRISKVVAINREITPSAGSGDDATA